MANEQELDEKKKAFYTVLAAAVLVDGKVRPLEGKELEALMMRTMTLSKLPEKSRDQLRIDIVRKLRKSFESPATEFDRVREACKTLHDLEHEDPHHNTGLCKSAFLHALDLVHTDDHLTKQRGGGTGLDPKEVSFLRFISERLHVPWHADDGYEHLMQLKNSV